MAAKLRKSVSAEEEANPVKSPAIDPKILDDPFEALPKLVDK